MMSFSNTQQYVDNAEGESTSIISCLYTDTTLDFLDYVGFEPSQSILRKLNATVRWVPFPPSTYHSS